MGRRQKIKEEEGISFAQKLLKLYEKFPDPELRQLGVIVDVNCHGVPYGEDHFIETFREFVFLNHEATVATIIQGCEHLSGLQVNKKVDLRGVFFLRESLRSYLDRYQNKSSVDASFADFPSAKIAAWVIVNVYDTWREFRSGEWAEKMGVAYYEENKSSYFPRNQDVWY